MSVYIMSDLHLGHKNILKFRQDLPFNTVDEHDDFIINNMLQTLSKRDKIILLGDVCFDRESMYKLKQVTDFVESSELILGNHDLESSVRPSLMDLMGLFGNKIYAMKKYKGVWLTHAPLHPDELCGCYNVHGHVHGNTLSDERYFNASCENVNYVPLSFDRISRNLIFKKMVGGWMNNALRRI